MKVYLAGSISGQSKEASTEWRDYVKSKLKDVDINAYSPMRGYAYTKPKHKFDDIDRSIYHGRDMNSVIGVNVRDFNDVKTADAVFVNLFNAQKVSIGTVMEIAWARAFQIPVVIYMENGGIHDHGMLTFGNIVVTNLEDGIDAIKQILKP